MWPLHNPPGNVASFAFAVGPQSSSRAWRSSASCMQHTAPSSTRCPAAQQHLCPIPLAVSSQVHQCNQKSRTGQHPSPAQLPLPSEGTGRQVLSPGHVACSAHWPAGPLDSQRREQGGENQHVSPYPLFSIFRQNVLCAPGRFCFPG